MANIRKAVIPVAGLGTRFLPATKAIPKELMPVLDRPVLQYAVDEAREAGIEEFVFVNSMGKSALENHFDRHLELERALEAKGKDALLKKIQDAAIPDGQLTIVRQHAPKGLGHAIWCARKMIAGEPFAVMLPDEVLRHSPGCLKSMVDAYADTGGSLIAVIDVPKEDTKKYGILDVEGDPSGSVVKAKGMVEKPAPGAAPSTLACIGRYVLPGAIMDELDSTKPGAGGEIQLTDAIASLIGREPLHGMRYVGDRYDCGSVEGFLSANLAFAMSRPELAEGLKKTMRDLLDQAAS